jgi:SAM-dependent methyltransferase
MDGSAARRPDAVWRVLTAELTRLGGSVDVLDAGGGTGGVAVPLAGRGHRVTVVDPNPDSLAALERRAADEGVGDRVRAVQGEAGGLAGVVGAERFDLVCCHQVLEVVDDPQQALAGVAAVLRPGGVASLLVATRGGAALHRAVAGRLTEAAAILADPAGRSGPGDWLARRFDAAGLAALARGAGLTPGAAQGIRAIADLVPADVAESDAEELAAVEDRAGALPAFYDLAGLLHLIARAGDDRPSAPAPSGSAGPQAEAVRRRAGLGP